MKTKVFLTIIALFCLSATCVAKDGHRLRVGIALGGGGARGAAEVGVLKVIEEMGIPIDYIAGSSIGSIVGGLYAIGYDAQQLDTIFRQQKWLSLIGGRNDEYSGDLIR